MENIDWSMVNRRIASLEKSVGETSEEVSRHANMLKYDEQPPSDSNSKVPGSGGGDGMDTRIINLERDVSDVKVAIGKVETRLENIEKTVLTKGQAAIYLLITGIAIFGAGWWVVQQYLAPILASIPK